MDPREAFLLQEIESASPAKLRFLLLQKAHGLCLVVSDLWKGNRHNDAEQWVIRIQDIVTELLSGVVDPQHELAQVTSDLYVFLSKLVVAVMIERDVEALQNVTEILEIEMETWAMFVRQESVERGAPPAPKFLSSFDSTAAETSLNFEA
ncbi:MAG: flagellar protein FliS [Pirellula sp.]|jgi:flagellar protein FliS|nr:flagellar protein FliS [Pirellula sp.]